MLNPVTLAFIQAHPEDAAALLERCETQDLAALLAMLPGDQAAPVVRHLLPFVADRCFGILDAQPAAAIVRHLPVDSAAALLRGLDAGRRGEIIDRLPRMNAVPLRLTLRYPPEMVGAIIDPGVISVRRQMRAGEVVKLAKKSPELLRQYLYVLDERQCLIGALDTRRCLLAPPNTLIETMMVSDPVALRARSTLLEARDNPAWERFHLLPVVDRGNRFLGVLRRRALAQALGGKTARVGVGDTALSLADLYWQTSASVFFPARAPGGEADP